MVERLIMFDAPDDLTSQYIVPAPARPDEAAR